MSASHPDVLILGGGPAGASAARLLSSWGHAVRLVTRAPASGLPLAESIPPSGGNLFGALGVSEAIEAAGFVRCTGNTVWWGNDQCRVEPFGDARRGWQVTASHLERILLDRAIAAGAEVERLTLSHDEASGLEAAFRLDCSGRAGLLARPFGVRQPEPELRSVALVGVWRREGGWPVPDDSHTLVESYGDGWAWSVPTGDHSRHVAVMVDPRTSGLERDVPSVDVYRSELAKTRQFRVLVSGATLIAGPRGWDASMYGSSQYVADDVLLVGDAGSFVDPLSSAGVRKALVSAWVAAVVVHTCLVRPERRGVALQFFNTREAELYQRLRQLTREHLARAAVGHAEAFWADRAELLEASPAVDRSIDALRADPAVRDAFETIRAGPAIALTRGPTVRVGLQPAIGGNEIVLEQRLMSDGLPAVGVRYLRDVDLVQLVELAPAFDQVPDLFEAYCKRAAPVALPDFLGALATSVARGWLVWRQ